MTKNNSLNLITDLIKLAKNKGAQSADAVSFTSVDTAIAVRMGKLETIERSESCGVGLRVMIGKKPAIVSSDDLSLESLDMLAERAVAMAKIAPEDSHIGLAESDLFPKEIKDLELYDDNEPSVQHLRKQAEKTEAAALSVDGITNSEGAEASYGSSVIALATSEGFAHEYKSSASSVSVSVIAGEGTGMERDYDYSTARFASDLDDAEKIGKSASMRTLKRLNPRIPKTAEVSVIYDPRVSKSLVGTFVSAINGAAIARGTSFLKDSMGEKIFKDGVNIINDPHIKRGLASKPFDGEGVANYKQKLIDSGELTQWLLDIRSANKLGLKTNGNASRGLASPPSPSSNNLYMENGEVSVEELIGDIKSGLYLTETIGMGINLITGDYSQGAAGFWIENGEIAYPVSEITIASTLQEMFKNLTPANDLEFKYGTNCPTVRIEKMIVAGQ